MAAILRYFTEFDSFGGTITEGRKLDVCKQRRHLSKAELSCLATDAKIASV